MLPPPCMPELRYTSRLGGVIRAVSRYGAKTLIAKTCESPSTVSTRRRLSVANASVVDHGVVTSEHVGLIGNLTGLFDVGQVPDDDVLGCREPSTSVIGRADRCAHAK